MHTNEHSHLYSFSDHVCVIALEGWGLVHSQLWVHMVQASLPTLGSMRISAIIPLQVQESPRAELTQLTLPQVQSIIYWTPDNNERRRGEHGFMFPFEEVPLYSPKDDFSL